MELTFFILRTRQIHTKPLFVSESTFKIKAISLLIFSSILLRSAVICKQRLFHKNEIVQYLQNYKYQDVNGDNFKKQLQTSKKAKKNNYPETAHKFLMCCSIFTYVFTVITFVLFWQINQFTLHQSIVKFHFTLWKQAKIHIPTAT